MRTALSLTAQPLDELDSDFDQPDLVFRRGDQAARTSAPINPHATRLY